MGRPGKRRFTQRCRPMDGPSSDGWHRGLLAVHLGIYFEPKRRDR